MNCDPLAFTGVGGSVALLLIIAFACIIGGSAFLVILRQRRRAGRAVLLIAVCLLVGGTAFLAPATLAQADYSDCVNSNNSLTVTQTSTMDNLAPGVPPVPIAGRVLNNSSEETTIFTVEVEITSVTPSPRAPAGSCNASDYILINPRMPVHRTLKPHESVRFAGASIGLRNKTTNQDACKNATIHLLYTANPTG